MGRLGICSYPHVSRLIIQACSPLLSPLPHLSAHLNSLMSDVILTYNSEIGSESRYHQAGAERGRRVWAELRFSNPELIM